MDLQTALSKLDDKRDAYWTEDGRPSLKRIHQLMKADTIKQKDLDEAAADIRRVPPEEAKPRERKRPLKVDPETGKLEKVMVKNREMMATERGFAAGAVRDPGETFVYTGIVGSWMIDAEDPEAETVKAEAEEARRKAKEPVSAGVPLQPDGMPR